MALLHEITHLKEPQHMYMNTYSNKGD